MNILVIRQKIINLKIWTMTIKQSDLTTLLIFGTWGIICVGFVWRVRRQRWHGQSWSGQLFDFLRRSVASSFPSDISICAWETRLSQLQVAFQLFVVAPTCYQNSPTLALLASVWHGVYFRTFPSVVSFFNFPCIRLEWFYRVLWFCQI